MSEEEKSYQAEDGALNSEPAKSPPFDEPLASQLEATDTTDESIPATNQPDNESMEVHHHAHHDHGKKNWKNYFWEFLMLFLAVLCGFIAEYQLEHKIERDRELQFMQTMAEDLRSDTAQLNALMARRKKRILEMDSLFNLIASDEYLKKGRKVYEWYELPHWDIYRFFPSDRTMQQLKNGGNLRLIRKKNVSNALIEYDVWIRNRKDYEALQVDMANQSNSINELLIDPVLIEQATIDFNTRQLQTDSLINRKNRMQLPVNIVIANLTPAEKRLVLKYIYQVKTFFLEYYRDHITQKQMALKTLQLVESEYKIQ
jgi:hypothetical protein